MKISNNNPIRIEFYDWHLFTVPEKNKVIIDTEKCELIAKKHITRTNLVNIRVYEICEDNIRKIMNMISVDDVAAYLQIPDQNKTVVGYRDGWYTNYKIEYKNGQMFTGKLKDIYAENPIEQALKFLREQYPYIEILKSV